MGRQGQILEFAAGHVIGQEMTAPIRLPARRRYSRLFHVIDNAVIAEVGGEIELAGIFDEVHMALPLGDYFHSFLPARFREVAQVPDVTRGRIVGVHLAGDVVFRRREDVVDLAITGGKHAVVGVVGLRKA